MIFKTKTTQAQYLSGRQHETTIDIHHILYLYLYSQLYNLVTLSLSKTIQFRGLHGDEGEGGCDGNFRSECEGIGGLTYTRHKRLSF